MAQIFFVSALAALMMAILFFVVPQLKPNSPTPRR
jgi:hypothetical protein